MHSLSLFCFQNQSALFLCLVSTRNTRSHFVWSPRTTGTLSRFFISKIKVRFPSFGLRHATRALPMFVRALSLYLVSSPDAHYLLFGLYKQRALSPVVWSGNLRCMISTRNAFSLLFGLYKQRALSPVVWSGNLRCMISTRNAFSLLFFPRRKMCAFLSRFPTRPKDCGNSPRDASG